MAHSKVDFLGIEAFLSIVEQASFREAAIRLNLSQTALSHRLRKLESGLGVQLLARTTRNITLTRAGLEFASKARLGRDQIADAIDSLRTAIAPEEGRLSIACLPTVSIYHLPAILREFIRKCPIAELRIFDSPVREIMELVQSGTVEFGITTATNQLSDLDVRRLATERLFLACRRDHPVARQKSVSWREVGSLPLIRIRSDPVGQAVLDAVTSSRAKNVKWVYEVQRSITAIRLVQAGLGVTVVPRIALSVLPSDRVTLVPLRKPTLARTLVIASKRGSSPSLLGEKLRDVIVDHFSNDTSSRQTRTLKY
jgi:DNA-binding transcriptional LysR family regulator